MALLENTRLKKEFGISDQELNDIQCFLQGAVYSWIKNNSGEVFAARDLVGGENYDWRGTPLICLYMKHKNNGKEHTHAVEEAGKDIGWILKKVLSEDKRTFESHTKGRTKGYRWIGNED